MKKLAPLLRPVLFSILIFLLMLFVSLEYLKYKQGEWEKDIRDGLLDVLVTKKSRLEKTLYSRIYYTKGVASFISLNPDISREQFDLIVSDFFEDDSTITSMAISRNCIISAIYPLEGHEEAIGLNLLEHTKRREIVEKTIETRLTFVAGPVELVEGGLAFISYTPVFDRTKSDSGTFWGVADIVIKMEALLKEATITESEGGFRYCIKGVDGDVEDDEVFFGDEAIFSLNPVTVEINLPYGNWLLAVAPEVGWDSFLDKDDFLRGLLIISSFLISILLSLFINAMLRLKQSEKRLKETNYLKDKFISVLAHDIKGALANIKGFTMLLTKDYYKIDDEKRLKYIGMLDGVSDSTTNLLENLLGWAGSQQGTIRLNPQSVDLGSLVQQEIIRIRSSADMKEITLISEIENECIIFCDPNLTGAVIRNILANAIKFSHNKSNIRIRQSFFTVNAKVYQKISIVDTGIGIDESKVNNLFGQKNNTPTYGTANEKGSGLGLLLCKNFVELQGGELSVESVKDKGSTFSFTLPNPATGI